MGPSPTDPFDPLFPSARPPDPGGDGSMHEGPAVKKEGACKGGIDTLINSKRTGSSYYSH